MRWEISIVAKVVGRKALEFALETAQTDALKKGLKGELTLLKVLESKLTASSIVIWDPKFLEFKPDILIIDPNLGFVFVEVKNWSLAFVDQFFSNGKSATKKGMKYPLGQTDNYINELQRYINTLRKDQLDIYRLTSSLVVYTGFSKEEFEKRIEVKSWKEEDFQNYYKKHLFLEDFEYAAFRKLQSSKKFNKSVTQDFTIGELRYIADSLGHDDEEFEMKKVQSRYSENGVANQKFIRRHENKVTKKVRKLTYSLSALAIFSLLMFLIIPLGADSNESYDKAVEDAKFAMANGEYQKALGLYELAVNEKPDDHETKFLYWSLRLLNELTLIAENGDQDKVIEKIDKLRETDKIPDHLERHYQELYTVSVEKQEHENKVKEGIEEIGILVASQKFDQAQSSLDNLKTDQLTKEELDEKEIKLLALAEQIEQGQKELLRKQEVAAESEILKNPIKTEGLSNKSVYMDKLGGIEAGLADLNYLYQAGVTSNILEAEYETLKRWDDALNEIYGVLKTTLSLGEMDRLRVAQREWIVYRDYEAELASQAFEGGTFEEVTLVSVKHQITRDRCYSLVENFMK